MSTALGEWGTRPQAELASGLNVKETHQTVSNNLCILLAQVTEIQYWNFSVKYFM